jgi:hypothetical protein
MLVGSLSIAEVGAMPPSLTPVPADAGTSTWTDRAVSAATLMMRSGDGERIARAIQRITHPSGKNPQLRTFAVRRDGRRVAIRIATAWQGGITSADYETDVIWELDDQAHIAARIVFDNAVVGVDADNARQLDDYFRLQICPILRASIEADGH